ncbi:D-alanyl-D-alanine carboxypeptidase [Streptomyces collinus]|uniref:D-alanyl-D-alanine carboxypeptidase n=1 Tax=Streptomyces collinus TaxID=42684 RepID=UPI00364B879D
MAGESPDRSKQRESSARETSGSASPVPEARSEVADPRLAVARDPERSAARGGADTATRVLSTRTAEEPENAEDDAERADGDSDTEDAAADAGQGTSGPSEGAKGSEGSEDAEDADGSDGSDGSHGSDGRLRDAVAAWVASADEGESAAAEGAGKGEKADEAEKAEEADAGAQEAGEATGAAKPGADAEDDAEDDRADQAAEAGTDAEDAEEAQEAAETASEGLGAGRGDAAEPEADRSADADAEDAAEAETEAEADERTDDEDSEPSEPGADNDVKGPKATDTEDDGTDAAPKADAAEDKPGPDTTPKSGGATDTKGDAAAGDKPGKADDVTGESDADTDDSPAKPPVDQPTAVFKTVRPPVDQPTTMLKLGGAAKDLPKSDLPKTDASKKDVPEKDAERTSKFVALKPLDDPSARKPAAPAAPAAPAEATAPVPTIGPERTTQQPLPPRPPLDLLAELTNTPPPPETPLRTAARRVKIWTPLVLLLVVVFAVVQSVRPLPSPTLELTAKDSYTFEGGKVDIPWPTKGQAALDVQGIGTFGSSGEQKPVPIASVAKVMTAYVILRDHPLKSGADGPKIPIDQAAQDQSDAGQESTVDVTKGDAITEREALESILIASANNVARLLARWDAGSEKAFVQKMNDAAADLGMKNTTYTDPSGLNNTTVSTAVDQVKLAKAAMQQPVFREVAAMMSYVDYKGKKHDNWNRLVGYNDVTGIKTGTTTSALGNLVFAAKKDVNGETRRIIGAVVRQPAGGPDNTILGAALHEGDKLIRAAQGALESATILKKGDIVGYADDGLGGRTPVAVTKDVTAVGWAGLSVKLTFAADDLPHTAKAGTKVGTLTVGDGTTSAVKVPVALQKDLVEPGFTAKLTRLG